MSTAGSTDSAVNATEGGQHQSVKQEALTHQPTPQQQVPTQPASPEATQYASTLPIAAGRMPPGLPTTSFTPVSTTKAQEAPPTVETTTASTSNAGNNPRQRSSIACLHCRKSKIRCVNEGIDTQCNACRNTGRECRYSAEMSKRGRIGEDEADRTPKRTRNRKSEIVTVDGGAKGIKKEGISNGNVEHSPRPKDIAPTLVEEGILDPNVLTPRVWSELWELFETHFGTDLPFLHSPTFSRRLREAPDLHPSMAGVNEPPRKRYDSAKLPGWEMLVLGILALTARFHPFVVNHLCAGKDGEKNKDPVHASEHYAIVLRAILVGAKGNYIGQPNLAKIQALLMLGLYEWGICNGVKAWIHVGLAIRMSQAMGLQFEDDQDFAPLALCSATQIDVLHLDIGGTQKSNEPLDPASNDAFIEEEMRRRTFWSCFIMDRYLSSGKFRPSMLMLDDIKLQLPCGQNAFLFGHRVCTALLDGRCSGTGSRTMHKVAHLREWQQRQAVTSTGQPLARERALHDASESQVHCEYGQAEGVLSIHVRMVEIWGRIAKWTCAGGIRNERFAPWHERSTFFQLDESLRIFQNTLPHSYKLLNHNTAAHMHQHTSPSYILLQVLYSFCVIVLHRELVPFVPVRCSSPQGPLADHQPWSSEHMPPDFYMGSARRLFKTARDIMDLVQTCHQSKCPLPETPVVGFGLYTVAFIEIYALNFPHMDSENFVLRNTNSSSSSSGSVKAASQMLEIIGRMRPKLPMANNWFRTIHRVHRYYQTIIAERLTASTTALNHRAGTSAPYSENLALLEQTLREFGTIEDEDIQSWTQSPALSPAQVRPLSSYISRDSERSESHRLPDNWTAVNAAEAQRPASSALRLPDPNPRSDYHRYAGPPSHTSHTSDGSSAPQPPDLSRGNTPTPSAASASPYQGPPAANGLETDGGGFTGQLSIQQLAQQAAQPPPVFQPVSNAYTSNPQHPSLPSLGSTLQRHSTERPQITVEHGARAQNRPSWTTDLTKSLSGDDVAAFMDGLSCQDWAEAFATRAGFRGGIPSVTGTGGSRAGWLTSVWRSSAGSVAT